MRRLRRAIKKAANTLANAVSKAADAIADVVQTVGNAVGDALSWLGSKVPGVSGVFEWLGDIFSAATDLVGSVIKAAGAAMGGVLSGVIKIVGGLFTLDPKGMLEGLLDIVSGTAGAVLVILGEAAAVVQVVFTIGRSRPLNQLERRLIALVFQSSIATYNVRVVEGFAGIYSVNTRPFVLGNTMYMKDKTADKNPDVFLHECVHVWQNQHVGSRYTAEALASQQWGVGYDWETEADRDIDWIDFGREAQAELIRDTYVRGGTTTGVTGDGSFFAEDDEKERLLIFNKVERTELANDATRVLRGRSPWRLSGYI